jgi:hypothetical protein
VEEEEVVASSYLKEVVVEVEASFQEEGEAVL